MKVNLRKKFTWFNISLKLAIIFKPLLSLIDGRLLSNHSQEEPLSQPIFIIGAPRTGSTLLYQIITNTFEVSYIDNLTHILFRNILTGFTLSYFFFRKKAHNNFKSSLGETHQYGLHAPSECGEFWYQWIESGISYVPSDYQYKRNVFEIKSIFNCIINTFKRPLVIKNNNISLRLNLIRKIYPDAKFVWIKRDPIDVAYSILHARMQFYEDFNHWWSLKPKNWKEISNLPPSGQAVAQVYFIERQIKHDLDLFNNDNILILEYENLQEPNLILQLQEFIGAITRNKFNLPSIKTAKNRKRDNEIISQLQIETEKYDWINYT